MHRRVQYQEQASPRSGRPLSSFGRRLSSPRGSPAAPYPFLDIVHPRLLLLGLLPLSGFVTFAAGWGFRIGKIQCWFNQSCTHTGTYVGITPILTRYLLLLLVKH
ncbi:hypothetical protein F4781DRAFT_283721 [Annulohypoxylon bovei var. microspora]|nr:hypothetical protein F4781DRAFT_283721 [Annulohypoxylon bovei var. microspora]